MNLLSKAKRVAAFAALTLTLALSTASIPHGVNVFKFAPCSTSAAENMFREFHYFSDATHTTHVGTRIFRCDGTSVLFGQSTQFSQLVYISPCCAGFPCQ